MAVMWGIIGAIAFSIKMLLTKWLKIRRDVGGDVSGIAMQLVESTLGTICLIITTFQGKGLNELGDSSHLVILIASVAAFTALVISNYTVADGIGGVAASIFSTSAIILVILSSIFLDQVISNGQIAGVLLCLLGASVLFMGDMFLD